LEKYYSKDSEDLILMLELKDEDEEYEVEEVKDKVAKAGYIRYFVKWLDRFSKYN